MNAQPKPIEFITVTPTMRGLIENVIEDLLLLLDEIDGDADLEEGGDTEADFNAVSRRAPAGFPGRQG